MSDPSISLGDMSPKAIGAGDGWTPLAILPVCDGRTAIDGQLAVTMPETLKNRAAVVELQLVRLLPGGGEDPTGQDDRQMCLDLDLSVTPPRILRVRKRQNWLYHHELRTYANAPLRLEARHSGPVTISLEWVAKAVLLRPEASG